MDPADLRPASDSPPKELGGRSAVDAAVEGVKLDEWWRSGELRTINLESSDQAKARLHPCGRKDFPQVNAEGDPKFADHQGSRSLEPEAACLTLGRAPNAVSVEDLHRGNRSACEKEHNGEDDEKPKKKMFSSGGLALDLNVVDTTNVAENNPFFPYKKLGQSKVSDPSECGSTTGPIEENESLRKWREMKQNGFLSSSQCGSAMVPKPCGRPKRKKDEEFRRNSGTQNEQTNKIVKVAAPSGLLSGLNPGIINHVRNSKQVYSIIKAMVHSEKLENENHQVSISQMGERGKEVSDHSMFKGNNANLHQGLPTTSKFLSKDDDENLKLQLSSAITMASERTCSASTDDLACSHDYMTSLSVKAAGVASQWLGLLQQDIRGRLAALKRSRKRVRNAMHTELPYLQSTEFSSSQENESSIVHSSEAGPSAKAVSEAHMTRWRSLFAQMDKALQDEGRHLENMLRQVQEMEQNCDKGLKHMIYEAPLPGPLGELCKLKKSENSEREWAVQAAAASIYSTCNLVMRTENVHCF